MITLLRLTNFTATPKCPHISILAFPIKRFVDFTNVRCIPLGFPLQGALKYELDAANSPDLNYYISKCYPNVLI